MNGINSTLFFFSSQECGSRERELPIIDNTSSHGQETDQVTFKLLRCLTVVRRKVALDASELSDPPILVRAGFLDDLDSVPFPEG
jgi:hypothetical protein